MKTITKLLFALLLGPVIALASEPFTPLACTSDWQQEAKLAREKGVPILVVFSSDTCMPCEKLKNQLIEPMRSGGRLDNQVHVTEFDINRGGKVTDFDGERVRSRIFVNRYDVFATPTVLLLNYDGQVLTAPLVGYDASTDYSERLHGAIMDATVGMTERVSHAAVPAPTVH